MVYAYLRTKLIVRLPFLPSDYETYTSYAPLAALYRSYRADYIGCFMRPAKAIWLSESPGEQFIRRVIPSYKNIRPASKAGFFMPK
jgi:hypothetical protein